MARLPRSSAPRTRMRSFRLSEQEDEQLSRMLAHSDISLPKLIRQKLFQDKDGTSSRPSKNITRLEYLHLLGQLQGVGRELQLLSQETTENIDRGRIPSEIGAEILEKLEAIWLRLKRG